MRFCAVFLLATLMVLGFSYWICTLPACRLKFDPLTLCKWNLRTIDRACQDFAEAQGRKPRSLVELLPRHLMRLPTCPVSGDAYVVSHNGPSFTVYCEGKHHAPKLPADHPHLSLPQPETVP